MTLTTYQKQMLDIATEVAHHMGVPRCKLNEIRGIKGEDDGRTSEESG